ncbi:MAG TPA: hypothetical protein VN634_17860 [Candidatus Limnocylindrales bacterium]|nr:hypothetical protein [Candidatus Limnocylindrales bacterium]
MSPLAAVNGQTALREKFATEPAFKATTDIRDPAGPRASAVFSIAGRVLRRERKVFHYKEAATLATKALESGSSSEEGSRSIRGHAYMRLARLGYVSKMWEAKDDFTRSLALRIERHGDDSRSAGEGMVDLGFCLIVTESISRGYALMQEGLERLRKGTTADHLSFLMRGLRQFELASRLTGHRSRASDARQELRVLEEKTEALDQSQQWRRSWE